MNLKNIGRGCVAIAVILTAARAAFGGHLDLPQADDTNADSNVFETTLTAMETAIDLDGDGVPEAVHGFNGLVPGPEIRVKVGDTVIVHFNNALMESSSIHFHGIELNNASDGSISRGRYINN